MVLFKRPRRELVAAFLSSNLAEGWIVDRICQSVGFSVLSWASSWTRGLTKKPFRCQSILITRLWSSSVLPQFIASSISLPPQSFPSFLIDCPQLVLQPVPLLVDENHPCRFLDVTSCANFNSCSHRSWLDGLSHHWASRYSVHFGACVHHTGPAYRTVVYALMHHLKDAVAFVSFAHCGMGKWWNQICFKY